MEEKHKHHTLPLLYLKGFAEAGDKPFIWLYTKGKPFLPGGNRNKHNPARVTLRSASVVYDAYGYTRRDGALDSTTFENKLEKLEKPSDKVLRKIRARRPLDLQDKWTLTSYILLIHKRGLGREERVRAEWGEFMKGYLSPEYLLTYPPEKREEVKRILEEEYKNEPPKEILLRTMVMEWGEAPHYLASMNWRFLVADKESRYVTGENPVFTSSLGLKKVAAELTFPLSTEIALHASWQPGHEGYLSAPEEYVQQLNQRIATNSKQLFYHRAEEGVAEMLNQGNFGIRLLDVSGHLEDLWENQHLEVELDLTVN